MDHPNIARLLDGGATPEGLPYFVMDYVAAEASAIAFGILLEGKGTVWINDVRFESVSDDVPVTELPKQLPSGPCNLGFDQTE